MIWYLLYPFRGTTDAPVLDHRHPIRHAFTRYGHNTAHHPIITLVTSIVAAAILIFPFPFLYTNDFTNGSSNLPHHVWTSAQPFEGPATTSADVVMRSVWVHGSYMKALESNVFQRALEIQDYLLGPTVDFDPRRPVDKIDTEYPMLDLTTEARDKLHAINGLSDKSWFFHSPLQYWSCSMEKIKSDKDILTTINQSARQATSLNVTLRHSIVFSGKRFEDHRIVAADALVITLIHMQDSPVGRQWERKAEELALKRSKKWHLYPEDGRSLSNTLYEFRFQPLSLQDDLFLGAAYGLTLIYFFLSLSKLRAIRTELGLIIAIIVQIAISIMASFTVCAVFKVDLSKIPREAYPLVVLTVGLENMFRLINAVITTRSEDSTAVRIGEALGKTSHVALAGVCQNLAILWVLSRGVYPQITAFCTFAAVALTFDFFFLLTFFAAVLSIDLRRMELGDALNRAVSQHHLIAPSRHPTRQAWTDAILNGQAPFPTRTAGTVVMISFVLMAQWHFFDNESLLQTASRLFCLVKLNTEISPLASSLPAVDIHQARTPTAWLRMQDHETAHEVIKVVKPHANSYIARVYDPLVFVVNGSDRTPNELGVRTFLPAAYDFAKHQFGVFLFTIVITVVAVSLLLNYLLWDEIIDSDDENRHDDEPLISIINLSRGHALDIALLKTSKDGILATVGLDRWVRIWNIRKKITSYVINDEEEPVDPFPVLALAIDTNSNWIAILSAKDKLLLWNIPERRWGPSMHVHLCEHAPAGFYFGHNKAALINPILLIRRNGLMSELNVSEREEKKIQISPGPLLSVHLHAEKYLATPNPPLKIFSISKKGSIHQTSQTKTGWSSSCIEVPEPNIGEKFISILPVQNLSLLFGVRMSSVELIDLSNLTVVRTFPTKAIQRNSLRVFHSTRRRSQCGSPELCSLVIAYTCVDTGSCLMHIYLPQIEGDSICSSEYCQSRKCSNFVWRETREHQFEIENPGQWEALQSGYLIGIRKREARSQVKEDLPHTLHADLRRRGIRFSRKFNDNAPHSPPEQDLWEVWAISARGERYAQPLCGPTEQDYLLIGSLGPMQVMGRYSVAVGLGNMVKVISVGKAKFDCDENLSDDATFAAMAVTRRRRPNLSKRKSR
ncbi:BgTH12-04332 [Blumeria graminis f. sp. triticale]|uniref:BgTH12-04332 n=1 Tax=Blumeria graminis f. sp. triticale TaxID=1689686 RepID=A0A9W4DFU8_BLUGR|nr:BgTH12-04332 [Blumeria graminis f. sp. triticale]